MKAFLITAIRFVAVTILYFVCFAVVSGALLSTAAGPSTPADASAALAALFAVSLINAAVWTYVILRSRWTGWKLIVTVLFVFFGVSTLMPQIETAYFITRLPPGLLPRLFLAGIIMALVFAPLAVLILGKARSEPNELREDWRQKMSTGEWISKLSLIVLTYLILYFTFGYFIAWKNPAVRAFYGGNDPSSFVSHIASLLRDEPALFLLQAVRALLWTAIAVPVIKMMRGAWWEAGLAVALLFAVMTSQLLLPNPLMPAEVRMAHLIETATSNFLFGWLVVLIYDWTISSRLPAGSRT
ncbi:MAG TPA: hypothetical protein VJP89_15160 [Pyrinomonadaceae bacterium]|nr:hypothetical protein [Pyrinomonadaceae bacterium]